MRIGTPAQVYQRDLLEEVFEAPLEVELRVTRAAASDFEGSALASIAEADGGLCKRRWVICGAVNNHERLRAREDGAKPSPPRDCKAEIFGACHCSEF